MLDFRSNGPRFDPRLGHGDYFKSVINGTQRGAPVVAERMLVRSN